MENQKIFLKDLSVSSLCATFRAGNARISVENLKKLQQIRQRDRKHTMESFGWCHFTGPCIAPKLYGDVKVPNGSSTIEVTSYALTEFETNSMMEKFMDQGFINYCSFNPEIQNFVSLTEIGKNLLLGDFMESAHLFLQPRPTCANEMEQIKELIFVSDTRAIAQWVENLPDGIFKNLFTTMKGGKLTPRNAHIAFQCAEEVTFFVTAFLESVWNDTVNRLIHMRGGLRLVPGDFVLSDPDVSTAIHVLTEDDIELGHYSIHDVVIPICGEKIKFPENDVGSFIDESLKSHGILSGIKFFGTKNTGLPVSFAGKYRPMLMRPKNLTWNISDDTDDEAHDLWYSDNLSRKLVFGFTLPAGTHIDCALRQLYRSNETPAKDSSEIIPLSYQIFERTLRQVQVELLEGIRGKPWEQNNRAGSSNSSFSSQKRRQSGSPEMSYDNQRSNKRQRTRSPEFNFSDRNGSSSGARGASDLNNFNHLPFATNDFEDSNYCNFF